MSPHNPVMDAVIGCHPLTPETANGIHPRPRYNWPACAGGIRTAWGEAGGLANTVRRMKHAASATVAGYTHCIRTVLCVCDVGHHVL